MFPPVLGINLTRIQGLLICHLVKHVSYSHIEELTLWIRLDGEQKVVTEFQWVESSLDNCQDSQSEELHCLNASEESSAPRLCNIARDNGTRSI